MDVVPMLPAHADRVARLHRNNLSSPFQGRPGLELLRAYYTTLATGAGGSGFVAQEGDELLGFVCGIFDPPRLKKQLLKGQAMRLAVWGGLAVLTHPGLLFDLASRLLQRGQDYPGVPTGYELRPIVVSPAARGQGVAYALLSALLADAAGRGFDRINLYTEEDNLIANRFYQKNAFQKTGEFSRAGRLYSCYERMLIEVA
jgi:ribosomal protein S18 acetylase RimI-like enzyme